MTDGTLSPIPDTGRRRLAYLTWINAEPLACVLE